MSLAFLTPEAGELSARSPMERSAVRAGARIAAREGWNVALDYGDPDLERTRVSASVGFADRSSLTKLELLAEPELLARVLADAGAVTLEQGSASRTPGTWWCAVTPARALVLSEPATGSAVRAAVLAAAERAAGVSVIDVTCGLAGISLHGPGARELLARFCAIDARPAVCPRRAFRPGSVARTPGYVLAESDEGLLLLFGSALGEYLWEVVADAAEHLHGGPVGADALARHLEALDA